MTTKLAEKKLGAMLRRADTMLDKIIIAHNKHGYIQTIKKVREITGWGLMHAKDCVDRHLMEAGVEKNAAWKKRRAA